MVLTVTLLALMALLINAQAASSAPDDTSVQRKLAASPCPNDPSITGYSSWSSLSNDIQYNNPSGGVFLICPGTQLAATTNTVLLEDSNTILSCGANGGKDADCILTGLKMSIRGPYGLAVNGVEFRGITFEQQSGEIFIGTGSRVAFKDCTFRDTQFSGSSFLTTPIRVYPGTVDFSDCEFVNNEGDGVVSIWEGSASFDRCSFRQNRANNYYTTGSAIVVGYEEPYLDNVYRKAGVTISASCFVGNVGDSTVLVNPQSSVNSNEDNFGLDNGGPCNGILIEESDGSSSCDAFGALSCRTKSPTFAPTVSPTRTPTRRLTLSPSQASPTPRPMDSQVPSEAPTPSPSNGPSSAPTSKPSYGPSSAPTSKPSFAPSNIPSAQSSERPSVTDDESTFPTDSLSVHPSTDPTSSNTPTSFVSAGATVGAAASAGAKAGAAACLLVPILSLLGLVV